MHPILFYVGPVPVRAYGTMVLVAFVTALWYAMGAARRRLAAQPPDAASRITPDHVFDMSLIGLFIGIVGTRLMYVALDWHEFANRPIDILRIWTGGLSIHGAIISGTLWLVYFCRRNKLSFYAFADLCAPAFALGYAIGRIGCFLNGCCYGSACSLPWAVRFVQEGTAGTLTPPSHPTQLYATAMNLAIFAFLEYRNRRAHREGTTFYAYLALYCIYRFIDEQFRKGATADIFVLGLTHAQAFSLVALPVILLLLVSRSRRPAEVTSPA